MMPTSTDVSIQIKDNVYGQAEAVILFAEQGAKRIEGDLRLEDRQAAERLLSAGVTRGKAREVVFNLVENGKGKVRRVFVVGLGPMEKISAETMRQSAAAAVRAIRKQRLTNAAVILPAIKKISVEAAAEAVVVGMLLANFDYQEYKGTAKNRGDDGESREPKGPLALTIIGSNIKAIAAGVARGRAIADGQNFARTIASRPGNDINPPVLAKVAQQMARETGMSCRVLDEKQMAKLGMGGILAVGAGSSVSPPRMIVLEYKPGGATLASKRAPKRRTTQASPLLIIGKAITFDTGGISIKPAEKMQRMIFDKCGGMAVLGLMAAIAKLKLPVHVVGILASAENHISQTAYRPGDILRMYNGVTVEVTNTDAEGRLVLGDALAWGIETYNPSAVVNLATLTGGVIVALGRTMAGVMSNNDGLVDELNQAAERAGEKIWRLPLGDEQREQIKSEPADIVNSAGRDAHPLQGGAFLSYFIPQDNSLPWAHLDIAGVADTEKELPYYGKGATGWGVRTLVEWMSAKV